MANNKENKIYAAFLNISELFTKALKIPEYQRPYSWGDEQVIQLIDDLTEAWEKDKQAYLVGNIIIHEENQKWKLVDGQQRMITFALILHFLDYFQDEKKNNLDNGDKSFLNLNDHSPLSIPRLKKNFKLIKSRLIHLKDKEQNNKKFLVYFLNQTVVTYTLAESQDQAFFYFDSQNTRGKSLVRKD
jgi:uncharacterized protein with ParB-like and HNH nuclease domain